MREEKCTLGFSVDEACSWLYSLCKVSFELTMDRHPEYQLILKWNPGYLLIKRFEKTHITELQHVRSLVLSNLGDHSQEHS